MPKRRQLHKKPAPSDRKLPVCEHGISKNDDCEQCQWEQSVADDQATDEDWNGAA